MKNFIIKNLKFIFLNCMVILIISIMLIYDFTKINTLRKEYQFIAERKLSRISDEILQVESDIKDERIFKINLRSQLPYEGLLEEYIDCTSLGKPDEYETCRDFYKLRVSARTSKYRWRYPNGKTKAVATIGYWDNKKDVQVPGYIIAVNFYSNTRR